MKQNNSNTMQQVLTVRVFSIDFCTCEYHIDPETHEFAGRRHQVEDAVKSLDHKRGLGIRTLYRAHVIDVDLVDRLEIDAAPQLGLAAVRVVA